MEIQLVISFTFTNDLVINLMVETFWDDLVYGQFTSNGVGVHTSQESIPVLLHEWIGLEVLTKMRIIDYNISIYYTVSIMISYSYCVGMQQGHYRGNITNIICPMSVIRIIC